MVLAVITHAMSPGLSPNSSAIEGPMQAIDRVSKPSRSATAKHSATTSHRRAPIGARSTASPTPHRTATPPPLPLDRSTTLPQVGGEVKYRTGADLPVHP